MQLSHSAGSLQAAAVMLLLLNQGNNVMAMQMQQTYTKYYGPRMLSCKHDFLHHSLSESDSDQAVSMLQLLHVIDIQGLADMQVKFVISLIWITMIPSWYHAGIMVMCTLL